MGAIPHTLCFMLQFIHFLTTLLPCVLASKTANKGDMWKKYSFSLFHPKVGVRRYNIWMEYQSDTNPKS